MSDDPYLLYCDGASRGNPGPAAIGGVIYRGEDHEPVKTISEFIGMATNNEAEYRALIAGLTWLRDQKARNVQIRMDSQLVVRQILGQYRVKNERMKPLFQAVVEILREIPEWKAEHVPREENREADRLANLAYEKN